MDRMITIRARAPYVFCEPFAGSAALTYWLLGGKPPISYMGGKSGYAPVIADLLGLSQHHKPAGIILGEPGPFAAVHATLGGASGSAEDVAGWLWSGSQAYKPGNPSAGLYVRTNGEQNISTEQLSANTADVPLPAARAVANIIRSWKDEEPRALWERLKAKGWPSLLLPEGCRGRWLGPQSVEEVAGYLVHSAWGFSNCVREEHDGYVGPGNHLKVTGESLAGRCVGPTLPLLAVWQGVAEDLALPPDLSGAVIFADPPYAGTTKYKHGDCNRETVLRLARDWSGRGATVAISEAVRLDRELGEGWHAIQIDHARKGAKRTFSRQQDEWVTLNRPPVHVPGKQVGLW